LLARLKEAEEQEMVGAKPTHTSRHGKPAAIATAASPWRRATARELAWLVLIKLAALTLLWWLFFSGAHRTPVDDAAAGRQLGVDGPVAAPGGATPGSGGVAR
jgi:ferric-dicitrate binding protein FerR (iron transport regulator)